MSKHWTIPICLFVVAIQAAWGGGVKRPWSEETLELFRTLPVQEGGRVKPLDTFAQFRLLKLNGKRTFTTPAGDRKSWMPWFLDCLFYPKVAVQYACLIVDNSDVVTSIGVPPHQGRRSRYSYAELQPGREKLFELAREYMKLESSQRSPLQSQIIDLANNVFHFEQLTRFLDFSKKRYHVHEGDTLAAQAFSDPEGVSLSTLLQRAPDIVLKLETTSAHFTAENRKKEHGALAGVLDQAARGTAISKGIHLFPPLNSQVKEWLSPMDMFVVGTRFPQPREERLELLSALEQLPSLRNNPIALNTKVRELNRGITTAAKERGEYKNLPLEVHLYKYKYLTYSQWLYALCFLLTTLLWLRPKSKVLHRIVMGVFTVPTTLLIIGIVLRCIVRGRPPVSTLYETILFITAIVSLCALFMEFVNRRRIALSAGSFLGVVGMFLAFRYEAKEGVDTMPALIAVLDTNFWLATHVTTVVAGYAAGLFAAAISHVYIFGKLLHLKEEDTDLYKSMTRMSYGIICFGLLFATVGTILGGVWANDSWGRFWGWDPKENGALMIVLWMLIVLHARLAGYIKDLGLHVMAILLGMVVAFSWWGVNNLGVGLHAYGFIEGVWRNLTIFWVIETFVVLLAIIPWYQSRRKSTGTTTSAKAV